MGITNANSNEEEKTITLDHIFKCPNNDHDEPLEATTEH